MIKNEEEKKGKGKRQKKDGKETLRQEEQQIK